MTMKWFGPYVEAQVVRHALDALETTADELLRKANETVPLDSSVLKQSGQVDIYPAELTAAVSYDTPYAVKQHEDTSLNHPNPRSANSSANGRARWLELTAQENKTHLTNYLANRIKNRMRGAR